MSVEPKDREPLLSTAPGSAPPAPKEEYKLLKYGSLGFLILQNSSHVLLLRYSRVVPGVCSTYVVSVAVLFAELLKLVFCLFVLIIKEGGPLSAFALLETDIWQRKMDTLKVSVPALCYTLQNNLQFVAASHLGAELLQLLYQTKTLSTAIFGVIILSKSLRCNQWCALSVLVVGVVTAQSSQSRPDSASAMSGSMVGVIAALGVSVCSGFASVYLEKILKGDKTSIWVRNVQLCLFSIPLQVSRDCLVLDQRLPMGYGLSRAWEMARLRPSLPPHPLIASPSLPPSLPPSLVFCASFIQFLAVYQRDWGKVMRKGWLHGFCPGTWAVVCMFAFGGLLVAVVIRFADNNLKNLAMAVAILVSCMASVPLFGFEPNSTFGMGAALVIISIFMYAWQPKPATTSAYVPISTSSDTPTRGVQPSPSKPS